MSSSSVSVSFIFLAMGLPGSLADVLPENLPGRQEAHAELDDPGGVEWRRTVLGRPEAREGDAHVALPHGVRLEGRQVGLPARRAPVSVQDSLVLLAAPLQLEEDSLEARQGGAAQGARDVLHLLAQLGVHAPAGDAALGTHVAVDQDARAEGVQLPRLLLPELLHTLLRVPPVAQPHEAAVRERQL